MPEKDSICFDCAADFYDRTRALSSESMSTVSELLSTELHGRGPVLEVGVGTGRIGLLLHHRGVELTGVDLSGAMLRRLVTNAGGVAPFPLALADATALPFDDDSFGAALTCHVLHLIPAWREVLAEIVRVVKPGGVYVNDIGGWEQMTGPRVEMMEFFAAEAGFDATPRGTGIPGEVTAEMRSLRARERALPAVPFRETTTYAEIIDNLERGTWSCTWGAGDAARRTAGKKLRHWAASRYGDIDAKVEYEVPIEWLAYDLP